VPGGAGEVDSIASSHPENARKSAAANQQRVFFPSIFTLQAGIPTSAPSSQTVYSLPPFKDSPSKDTYVLYGTGARDRSPTWRTPSRARFAAMHSTAACPLRRDFTHGSENGDQGADRQAQQGAATDTCAVGKDISEFHGAAG